MKYLIIICLILNLSSCSTLKRTLIYSSLIGGFAGMASGVALSPNRESRKANALVFGAIGAVATGLVGYALYKDDPRNYDLKHMLLDNKQKEDIDLDLGNLKIDANLDSSEIYDVPIKELPEKLKNKVNKQYLIKYQSKERYIKKGSKTYYIPEFEVYEHAYENQLNN